MTAPTGSRVDVDVTAGHVTVREPTAAEAADIAQFQTEAGARFVAADTLTQRLLAARKKIKRALANGQGTRVVTVADLAELFGLDPDPNA